MKKWCFGLLTLLMFTPTNGFSACYPKVLSYELIKDINDQVGMTLREAGNSLKDRHCVKAAALHTAILRKLGFRQKHDYEIISTDLHVYVFYPEFGLISDTTIGQFFDNNRGLQKEFEAQNGFVGTIAELYEILQRSHGKYAAEFFRLLWRLDFASLSILPKGSSSQSMLEQASIALAKKTLKPSGTDKAASMLKTRVEHYVDEKRKCD